MNHEREQSHAATTATHEVDAAVAPGRSSRTERLNGPTGPRPSGLLMRKRDGNDVAANADVAVGAAASSSGSALPDDLRSRFEGSLGTDLSSVRVHTGAASADAASSVGARAYALGNDIHFAAGELDTSSSGGQHLLAHEVAHTVQQRGGSPMRQNKLAVSSPGDAFEHEADRAADAMVAGAPISLAGASIGLARSQPKKDDKKEKTKYPSWKDESVTVPIAPAMGGGLKLNWGETPGAAIGFKKEAKAELFKKEYSQGLQIAPGVTGSITGEVSGKLGASFKPNIEGKWVETAGDETQSLQMSAAGTGEVAFEASGSLQVSAGVGIANVLALEGGIKGEITAKTAASIGLSGILTRKPDGTQTGAIVFAVGLEAALEAAASLVVDVVVPGNRINAFEKELGKLVIGKAGVAITATYADGKVKDNPPKVTAEWLPVPPLEERGTRPITDEERKAHGLSPVDQGASGGMPSGTPDEVPLTDQELFDKGKADALAQLETVRGAGAVVVNGGAGLFGLVLVGGVPVRAGTDPDPKEAERDAAAGREIVRVTSGQVTNWHEVMSPTVELVKDCAKTPSAVTVAYLSKHVELAMVGLAYEYKDVPPKLGICKKDEGTGPQGM